MSMESSRISLRPFKVTNVYDVVIWGSDDRVTRTTRWKTLTSKEEALTFIKEVCIAYPWRVSICIDDRSIGFLWKNEAVADIGYAIAAEYWGKGIATKALKMAIPQVFNDFPEIVKIQAFVLLENKASYRVLEKAGFLYQSSITHQVQINGDAIVVVDAVYTFLSTDNIPPSP
ncbi:PREDICTED: uncharacterized protein LOC109237832 [Nicotiana attenuata]|uniref:uncharacterized protein LOC109237832 n=1 Tax=Nicotiana attenuata TaxID=49451 RepID=UPI000904BEAD|nr:PREDICTED: uncharacterized protein LOC109237832 [Nicotiana attenuata]